MQEGQFFVVPVDLPEGGIIQNFTDLVAVQNLILLQINSILPQSLTVQFMGTSDGIPANLAPIVAIIGPINSTVTIPRPPFYLRVQGELLEAFNLPHPAVVVNHPVIPVPVVLGAPGAQVPAVLAPVHLRIGEEEDFRAVQRIQGLFTSRATYIKLFYLTAEGAAPSGKDISWTNAGDVVKAALSSHNRLANAATTVTLTVQEVKLFLVKDYRDCKLSIEAFVIHGVGHESIFNALENLATLERTVTGVELADAIMHLRHSARDYYRNHLKMPVKLVAESINAHLERLRISPHTDPNAAHLETLAVRLRQILTFDPSNATVVGASISEQYMSAMVNSVQIDTPASVHQQGLRGGNRGAAGRTGLKRDAEPEEKLSEWLGRAPTTLNSARVCYDWLQKKGACAHAQHDSACTKKDSKGAVFLHKYPTGLTKDEYTAIDVWAKGQAPALGAKVKKAKK